MRWLGLGLVLILGAGCGSRRAPSNSSHADAATLADVEGVWVLALSEEETHRLLIRKLTLEEDLPGEPELRAMGLDDEDLGLLRQLRAMPRDAPQLQVIADEVARLEGGSITITRRSMRLDLGARTREVGWTLLQRSGDTLTVQFDDDGQISEGIIRVGIDGSLIFIDSGGNELVLERL